MSRSVIIDCDPGTDDAIALWLALGSPEAIGLRMVTVAGGNAGLETTLPNACAIVGLSGRAVPVVAGAGRPLLGRYVNAAQIHGEDGLGGVRLPPGPPASPGLALDRMREALREADPGSVTLVGIGPATNLGLLLAAEPALADRVAEIVLMSGGIDEGNVTKLAEFNAYSDPEALAIVLGCGRPVTLATLNLTNQALCTPEHVRALRAAGGGACLCATAAIWESVPNSRRSGGRGHEQHDACAVAWLVAPELFTVRQAQVSVELAPGPARGRTVPGAGAPNVRLLETLDAEGFFALLNQRLARLP